MATRKKMVPERTRYTLLLVSLTHPLPTRRCPSQRIEFHPRCERGRVMPGRWSGRMDRVELNRVTHGPDRYRGLQGWAGGLGEESAGDRKRPGRPCRMGRQGHIGTAP